MKHPKTARETILKSQKLIQSEHKKRAKSLSNYSHKEDNATDKCQNPGRKEESAAGSDEAVDSETLIGETRAPDWFYGSSSQAGKYVFLDQYLEDCTYLSQVKDRYSQCKRDKQSRQVQLPGFKYGSNGVF